MADFDNQRDNEAEVNNEAGTNHRIILLNAVRNLVEVERRLTEVIEGAEEGGLLGSEHHLPTPPNMEAAMEVLALARSLSSRTSLPPFPAQLRSGALGAMQRKMTKMDRLRKDSTTKRRRLEEEEEKKKLEEEEKRKETALKEENSASKKPKPGVHGSIIRRGPHLPQRPERTFHRLSSSSSSSEDDDEDDESE